jgi:DNA-binding NarL/FixJ family response regulator
LKGKLRVQLGLMARDERIRVLTVDDHPLVRDGIAFAINTQPDMVVVAEGADGQEAVELYRVHRPDVTLLDLQMPKLNGIAAIEAIRAEYPMAKVVVLTTYAGDAQASKALKAGAAGYLLKSMLRTELIETIRAVHAGKLRVQPEIAANIAEHLAVDNLTAREVEVLRKISAGSSNKIVAADLGISEDTVKGHMKNILSKLGANDRTHAVLIAIKRGFLDG